MSAHHRLPMSVEEINRAYRELRDFRAAAESGDGLIIATVGPYGDLRELDLDPRLYRTPDSAALAADILATVQAAVTRAAREAVQTAAALLPDNTDPADADLVFDPMLHELNRLIGNSGER